ncbi:BrnA antitoxin family protein [Aliamphritea spongicola]|uniref:BrnA antitoxin family protein n=1 Tax=Aliamphritea spongicola TaxID=707589 RepID=UPI00196A61B5|nr:BrnA antitoxin family protein [Aliamphritea spongicola]MBN3561406.1 BrnA antitoxin family protein [Aliamphritea spongicola]
MKEEYDFAGMESRSNPYAARLKKPVTIRLDEEIISYFKTMSSDTGIPYQSLINLYLQDCVNQQRKIDITWQQEQ